VWIDTCRNYTDVRAVSSIKIDHNEPLNSSNDRQAVMGKLGLDTALPGHGPQSGAEFTLITGVYFRTAVDDDSP